MGAGHVMRCLALAQAWRAAGGDFHFLCASPAKALRSRLESEGATVHEITAPAGGREDAQATRQLAQALGSRWLVLDGYHLDASYQEAVRGGGYRLLSIDDEGRTGRYCADLILDQNAGASAAHYLRRPPEAELLLGSRYTLLREEFLRVGRREHVAASPRRILVSLGGGDVSTPLQRVLAVFQQLRESSLELDVVVGQGVTGDGLAAVEKALRATPAVTRLVHDSSDMARLMAEADLAIIGGGTTCWEAAYLGLPALIVVLADNQRAVARRMEDSGAGLDLGWHEDLDPQRAAQLLRQLASSPDRRAGMAEAGARLIDGLGGQRVVARMHEKSLALRPVEPDDCKRLWEWANDPDTRRWSFHDGFIPWTTHVTWFEQRLQSPSCLFLLAHDSAGAPVGQVRFEGLEAESEISVALAPEQRGKGLAAPLLRAAVRRLFRETTARVVSAYVRSGNEASLRAFRSAGFSARESGVVRGAAASHLQMRREDLG